MYALENRFPIKAYSKKELAGIYNVSNKTFTTWLKPFKEMIGIKRSWYYTVKQVVIIIESLGIPPKWGQ